MSLQCTMLVRSATVLHRQYTFLQNPPFVVVWLVVVLYNVIYLHSLIDVDVDGTKNHKADKKKS